MDIKIRDIPKNELFQIDYKAKKEGVSREQYLRQVITKIAEEDDLKSDEKYHKEILNRLIDTLEENNKLMDIVATHFGIEID